MNYLSLNKKLKRSLRPERGFTEIYPLFIFAKFRPKYMLVVDFEIEKYDRYGMVTFL